jgi:cysteine synthase B
MVAAMRGYRLILIMPENATDERKASMLAYGAELVEVSKEASMEGARDLALQMQSEGKGLVLDQFGNSDNPRMHYETTGPEIWRQTDGKITHFVSSMGTTGTIMGVSKYLKEQNPNIQIVGLQPTNESRIPGIRKWPKQYLPSIFDSARVDRVVEITQSRAEQTTRSLAQQEGICAGVSSGGAIATALDIAEAEDNALVVAIICDRGDRYLSSGIFNDSP